MKICYSIIVAVYISLRRRICRYRVTNQKGDFNCDGKVSAADAVLLCRFLTTQSTLPAGQMQLADLSGDNAVSAADLTLLKRQLISK